MQQTAVSVLVVDDHPALRAGLEQLLDQEPGYRLLGAVSSEAELAVALQRDRPDVVVLDYALTRGDGLSACFRLKQRPRPPAVVLYSAYVDNIFAVPATLAQADAIVSKSAPVEVLLAAIEAAAAGETQVPSPDPEVIEAASSRLDAEDLPILGMLFARVRVDDIATTLGVEPREVRSVRSASSARCRPTIAGTVTRRCELPLCTILRGGDRMAGARLGVTLVVGAALILPPRDGLVIVVAVRRGGGSLGVFHGHAGTGQSRRTAANGVARQLHAVAHADELQRACLRGGALGLLAAEPSCRRRDSNPRHADHDSAVLWRYSAV